MTASRAQVWTLMAIVAIIPFSFECIFPFINHFLLEIGVVKDPADAGFYSGVTESIYAVAQLVTVFPATWASDVYGRKPVVILSAAGIGISMATFGISTRYWMMIASRILGGVEGGSSTAIRVMAYEMSSKADESHIMSLILIFYRIGQILGQPVGGMLSHPERRWPELFDNSFWRKYPYALPCFVGAGYAFVCAAIGQIVLKETLASKRPKKEFYESQSGDTTPLLQDSRPSSPSSFKPKNKPSMRALLTWPLFSVLLSNAAMALVTEAFFAVYPLFAFTPIELGGLGLSEAKIGLHMSARSVLHVVTMFPYTQLENRFGRMTIYHVSLISWIPSILLFPVLNWIAKGNMGGEDSAAWYITLLTLFFVWSLTGWAWTSIFLMSSGFAPNKDSVATIQGLVSTSIIIPQAIGPALGTSTFALAVNYPHFLNGYLFWVVATIFSIIMVVHSFTIREASNDWREDDD